MKTLNKIIKYFGYASVSLLLGWCSTQGELDFIQNIQGTIIAILLTSTVLNTTLANLLLNEILKFRDKTNDRVDICQVLDAMKRNSSIELLLIAVSFVLIILCNWLYIIWPNIKNIGTVLIDGILIFDVGYFLLVIFDDVEGWYRLLKENNTPPSDARP